MRFIASRAAQATETAQAMEAANAPEAAKGKAHVPSSGRARLALALGAGKAVGTASRMLRVGGGTSFPGTVARRIDPRVLEKVVAASDARKVIVTGSNGKTTTCRMLAALAQANGMRVTQNRSGSNLIQGVITAAMRGIDLRGRMGAQLLLLEVDEATVRLVIQEVQPEVFLITNIFRDQLDRFGELHSMARGLEASIEALPASATVVLNGDDPLVASLAPGALARRAYFGIRAEAATRLPEHAADSIRCARCQHLLRYRAVYVSHLGDYRCPECGYARPDLDVAVTSARRAGPGDFVHQGLSSPGTPRTPMAPNSRRPDQSPQAGSEITVLTPAGAFTLGVPLPGLHNVYNAAAALTGAMASLERPLGTTEARAAMAGLRPAFGRLEEISAGERQVVLAFVKNPTSYNATLAEVLGRPGPKHVLAAHSNTAVDGEDFAWLWDVDLEQLAPQLASLVISGTRSEEVALRFTYAGARPAVMKVLPGRPAALHAALNQTPSGESLYIFAGYTPMRELRGIMQRRGWVPPSWEE